MAFALRLVDEFDGAPLAGGASFTCGGRVVRALQKADGVYAFLRSAGCGGPLTIHCPHYFSEVFPPSEELPTLTEVRLCPLPSRRQPGREWRTLKGPPGGTLLAAAEYPVPLRIQSTEAVEGGLKVTVGGYVTQNLSGKRFLLGEDPAAQLIFTKRLSAGIYLAAGAAHGETGAALLRACRTRAGEDGLYRIPVEPGTGPLRAYTFSEEGETWLPL